MKTIPLKIFLAITLLLTAANPSAAQKSVKEIIQDVENINFINIDSLPVNVCYVVPSKGAVIHSINGIARAIDERSRPFVIAAGSHTLTGEGFETVGQSKQSTGPISVLCEFEEGKCYRITFSRDAQNVYTDFEQITDTLAQNGMARYKANIERLRAQQKEYFAFQEANPNHLDGVWSGEKKRMMNTFLIRYTIEGNRMLFEVKNKLIKSPFTVEGQMLYNENTIVLIPEKATANGKAVENFDRNPKHVWYYTLINGVLHLEGGLMWRIWENTGDFRRINE